MGLFCPEYSTHQFVDTDIATPKLRLRPSTDRHATCWRTAGLPGDGVRNRSQKSEIEITSLPQDIRIMFRSCETTYLCVCWSVLCLRQTMDTTSCLEPWLLSKVTAHRSEVSVLWATIDTKPFFTFSLQNSLLLLDTSTVFVPSEVVKRLYLTTTNSALKLALTFTDSLVGCPMRTGPL